jgi:hypothetical protein
MYGSRRALAATSRASLASGRIKICHRGLERFDRSREGVGNKPANPVNLRKCSGRYDLGQGVSRRLRPGYALRSCGSRWAGLALLPPSIPAVPWMTSPVGPAHRIECWQGPTVLFGEDPDGTDAEVVEALDHAARRSARVTAIAMAKLAEPPAAAATGHIFAIRAANARHRRAHRSCPPRLTCGDGGHVALSDTDSITRLGRAVAVNVIAATQRPTHKPMGQGAVRSRMDFGLEQIRAGRSAPAPRA